MSQAQEICCLTKSQIETVMKNWFKILHVKKSSILSSGKPVFSKANEEKYNLAHITKFAEHYTLYECETYSADSEKECDDNSFLYFIVIEATKFDKLFITACSWYYHLCEKINKKTNRPQVFICPAHVVTDAMLLHIPNDILPCMYRFVSLCELYPLLGSTEMMFGLAFDYKIVNVDPITYNKRSYSIIYDSDVVVKMLNALPGEIIEYRRIIFEGSPYGEYYRREVVSTMNDVNSISPSGICNIVNQ